jgi:iron complex transport system substrate-binding protein
MNSIKQHMLFYQLICFSLVFFTCNQGKQNDLQDKTIRIISLSPHITEILYALEQEDKLVAVSDFCIYPPQVKTKERIGGIINPNIEKIVTLRPTYLFGQPAHEKLDLSLHAFGLSIVMMRNETVADLFTTINMVGLVLDCQAKAQQLAQQISDSLNIRVNQRILPRAMLVIGKNPGELKNIMVAGQGTFLDEIWQKAGGQNIYGDLAGRYQTITLESILERDPDIIILFNPSAPSGVKRGEYKAEWSVLHNITAFKTSNVYTVGGDYVLIPGPRIVQLARDMRDVIQQSGYE